MVGVGVYSAVPFKAGIEPFRQIALWRATAWLRSLASWEQTMTDASRKGYQEDRRDIDGYSELAELALDLRSSWNHAADCIWQLLDPMLWDLTHNPWVILQTVSRENLKRRLADPMCRATVEQLVKARRSATTAPSWFQEAHPASSLSVAYFSMEFMLSEALPIYSGGLGNVAGDQLKAAGDLGVPVVGVGLLYQQGYFRQVLDPKGAQEALYPYNDPGQLPILPLRTKDGEWLRLQIDLPGHQIWLRVWQAQVGRTRLYLLDSNDAANFPPYRGITSELYGGGPDLRILQELVLGIGGWRLLSILGVEPDVCHLNEGHAAFAVLERAHCFMMANQQDFRTALTATRAGNLFTTHTAVAVGFDRFKPDLIARHLASYARDHLDIGMEELLALGRQNPTDAAEDFNMAYLAIRGCGAVNGVSKLHGAVSRKLFTPLFPRWPVDEVPVAHVTNGVHMASWDSAEADALWTGICGKDRWLMAPEILTRKIHQVSDATLWEFRNASRASLVDYTRAHLSLQLAVSGKSAAVVAGGNKVFDPDVLTLGFARRFATYKRPNLLLHDPQRLIRILSNAKYPVQLIMAGKAHPADKPGQALIQQWSSFIDQPGVRERVVFLSDYDMLMTERLVQGVDVWLNTPRRPWEACGTSGMKVLVNGGLNLSELDGWWAEAYAPDVGWALGDGLDHGADADQDALDANDAEKLYKTLENDVIPLFYNRNNDGIPCAWVGRIRESMAQLTPRFSSVRAVRDYTEDYYLPAAAAYRTRARDKGAAAVEMINQRNILDEGFDRIRIMPPRSETEGGTHMFEVHVHLDDIEVDAITIELYADAADGGIATRLAMQRGDKAGEGGYLYSASVVTDRPAADFTARALRCRKGLAIPLEDPRIMWQR